jgi:hypothetical protein
MEFSLQYVLHWIIRFHESGIYTLQNGTRPYCPWSPQLGNLLPEMLIGSSIWRVSANLVVIWWECPRLTEDGFEGKNIGNDNSQAQFPPCRLLNLSGYAKISHGARDGDVWSCFRWTINTAIDYWIPNGRHRWIAIRRFTARCIYKLVLL